MFTLVCLTLAVIQNLFGCAVALMEGRDGFAYTARRLSEEPPPDRWEVPGPGAPGGPDVRGSGDCRGVPVSRVAGPRGLAGQESALDGAVLS